MWWVCRFKGHVRVYTRVGSPTTKILPKYVGGMMNLVGILRKTFKILRKKKWKRLQSLIHLVGPGMVWSPRDWGGGTDRFNRFGPSWSFMTNLVIHDQLGHLRPTCLFLTNFFANFDQLVTFNPLLVTFWSLFWPILLSFC